MIRVYASKRGEKFRLFVQGHAERSGEGALVCAAVSALTQALGLYAGQHGACRHVRQVTSHGTSFLSCCYGLNEPFDMIVTALRQLALEYPQHVCFCGESVDDKEQALVLP